ncbi:hypothetical protein LTS08_002452 [Lithohypha guttulata]|nr:hypothetical protein LTS08_002452 [Lithohypha guttulata]
MDASLVDISTLSSQANVLSLPPELLQHILSFLDAEDLVSLRRVCHGFRTHAELEQLWLNLIRFNVPEQDVPTIPSPAPTYRELFLSHFPRWHLPRNKIWFSDDAYSGKLILVKFDPRRGSIEGYRLTAEKLPAISYPWSYKPSVRIHQVEPRVYASTEDPVLSIPLSLPCNAVSNSWRWMSTNNESSTRFPELLMRVGRPEQRINGSLMLSKNLPDESANAPSVGVWPPRTIPNMPRTRSSTSSGDKFASKGHRPQTIEEISNTTFRLRTWSHFTQGILSLGVRPGEEISTWSTLDPALYTPTPSKPYQGIFVGDYASHGCEFLLVMQTAEAPPTRDGMSDAESDDDGVDDGTGTRHRNYITALLAALREQHFIDDADFASMNNITVQGQSTNAHHPGGSEVTPNVPDPDGSIHQGAIEAIKLTGDVNVPRGEHTFIADDIGAGGLIRIAAEHPFKGARVVRSRGHVAHRFFREGKLNHYHEIATGANVEIDKFIPSQLFLISPDLLAQYWLPYGHISFYKRIDVDSLLAGAARERRSSEC